MIKVAMGEVLFQFLEQSPAYVYVMDRELRYTYLNAASRNSPAYEGASLEEILGRRGQDFPLNDDVPDLAIHDREVLESGNAKIFEEHIVGLTLLSFKWPLCADDGTITGVGGISIDVTDLAEIQRAKMDYFINAMNNSHDIIEAVTSGLAELTKQAHKNDPPEHNID